MEKRTNQQISLHDGRTLGYAEYGAPEGTPVFYFHGFPSSRLDTGSYFATTSRSRNSMGASSIRRLAGDHPQDSTYPRKISIGFPEW